MAKRNLFVAMLLLLATAAVADEYTDSLTGVVYTYEKGSGVAKVKDGDYHAWDSRTKRAQENTSYDTNIVVLDSFIVDDCHYTVKEIGDYAFYYRNIISVKIPSTVTTIGNYVFQGCSKLQMVYLPDSLETLGFFSFSRCNRLTSVFMPSGMSEIPRGTFESCRKLREIILPESLTEIGDMSFACCSSLQEIAIPENVTRIGTDSFADCDSLSRVTIPNKITSIGSYAFGLTPKLTTVISHIEEPFDIDDNVFEDETYENGTLYVHEGCKEKYKLRAGWSRFRNIIEGSPTDIHSTSTRRNTVQNIYNLHGRHISIPPKGIYIQNGKKFVVK